MAPRHMNPGGAVLLPPRYMHFYEYLSTGPAWMSRGTPVGEGHAIPADELWHACRSILIQSLAPETPHQGVRP